MLELLVLGVVIGANNFAAALTLGTLGQKVRRGRIVLVFGVFEFVIPLVGIWLGRHAAERIADQAGWVGTALLAGVGLWTVSAAQRGNGDEARYAKRATTWRGLVVLAALLSIDNLIVGFSLGLGGREPLLLAGVIAAFAVAFAFIGLSLGARARRHHERWAETAAGVLLLLLAAATGSGWL